MTSNIYGVGEDIFGEGGDSDDDGGDVDGVGEDIFGEGGDSDDDGGDVDDVAAVVADGDAPSTQRSRLSALSASWDPSAAEEKASLIPTIKDVAVAVGDIAVGDNGLAIDQDLAHQELLSMAHLCEKGDRGRRIQNVVDLARKQCEGKELGPTQKEIYRWERKIRKRNFETAGGWNPKYVGFGPETSDDIPPQVKKICELVEMLAEQLPSHPGQAGEETERGYWTNSWRIRYEKASPLDRKFAWYFQLGICMRDGEGLEPCPNLSRQWGDATYPRWDTKPVYDDFLFVYRTDDRKPTKPALRACGPCKGDCKGD